jgi:VIT1/CCC1 family predicted Fe2+/Mn2+ transporter
MMSGPGDQSSAGAAGRGHLRASHADREQVIEALKTAFEQGRLTKDEFGTRVDQAFASKTYAELAEVTADLPAGLMAARPPRQLDRTRPRLSMNTALTAGAFTMIAALVGLLAALLSRNAIAVISVTVIFAMLGLLAFGALMVAAWRGRHANRRTGASG